MTYKRMFVINVHELRQAYDSILISFQGRHHWEEGKYVSKIMDSSALLEKLNMIFDSPSRFTD